MSVNRFEMTPVMLCAPPDGLMPDLAALDGATVIVDIRQDWATPTAFEDAQAVIDHRSAATGATFFRVGMPDDDTGQDALTRLIALRPTGFVLSGCGGAADIQRFDVMLRVAEAEHGIEPGSIAVFAEVGEHLAFFVPLASLRDISRRLKAVIFDSESFAGATASEAVNTAASRAGAPSLLARAAAVLAARQAGIACYELLQDNSDDVTATRKIAIVDGFSGVIARNTAQLAALQVP
ncbi:aldolase/citrate lyase family protein [Pararhizobium sp. YC-54]|uniref:aldolase/citrate lyase family protein n=1 Tax=Pararhizobium sp. YC-54 TaxID=2986920 RepID=UPI0021F6D0B3|nr:aldolase/citrate lyase family protein [Pararhizobium sp. YC-54]MCV9997255.1 aldolase/citrate lyase family protein [Pararhizobium sp. YC-54]